ncbi:hypothetical protein CK203_001183 [Vitis vinifera]|uniref:Uncharacterized protein n=1 Tax=Vitis vinifera TaxID=29760 RepID=A0A438KKF4_VITVI|nr:hypothetical protein CK203_001183 [Vitis vinifera]
MGRRPPISNQSRAQHYTQSTATKLGYKPEERRKKRGVQNDGRSRWKGRAASESEQVSLKDKGNEFFKAGNYLKAAALYTQAIKQDPSNPTLYRAFWGDEFTSC